MASILFTVAHVPAYTGGNVPVATAVLFVSSVLLGWLYEATDNLFVPAVAHGTCDAVLFASLSVYLGQM